MLLIWYSFRGKCFWKQSLGLFLHLFKPWYWHTHIVHFIRNTFTFMQVSNRAITWQQITWSLEAAPDFCKISQTKVSGVLNKTQIITAYNRAEQKSISAWTRHFTQSWGAGAATAEKYKPHWAAKVRQVS